MSNPICIFLIGGPGSGKDYVLNNIFSRFDLTEVQADQVLSGAASRLHEEKKNIVINGASTSEKIDVLKNMLEGYTFDCVYVSVTNKVSRVRNGLRELPLMEHKRIEKFLAAERLAENYEHFNFNNSINLNESSEFEKIMFASQIEKLLERVVGLGLEMKESPEPKSFFTIKKKLNEKREVEPAGQKQHLTPDQIAKKHKVDVAEIQKQLEMGRKVEHEHTKDPDMATDIALNHLGEIPDYYTRLGKMEKQGKAAVKEAIVFGRGQAMKPDEIERQKQREAKKNAVARRVRDRFEIHHQNAHVSRAARGSVSEEVWDEKNPKKESKPLTAAQKAKAKARAAKAGRKYPNLIDNMWASQLSEMQLVGTDEYRKHAIAMTPGQSQEIEDATKTLNPVHDEQNCCPDPTLDDGKMGSGSSKDFRKLRKEAKETTVDVTPTVTTKRTPKKTNDPQNYRQDLAGFPVTSRQTFNALESVQPTLEEAVQYHLTNNISITENVFRPGSDMFFKLVAEAKRLYAEGKYTPVDEYEQDLLNSDIGEKAMYEGQEVILDFPMADELNEEGDDPTGGKGIGKPFRSGGGGAVYVKNANGNIIKVNFSQSGMKKRYNEPGRVRSFVARHHCLTNKDRTSRSYWACRWPRYFSNTGQQWW